MLFAFTTPVVVPELIQPFAEWAVAAVEFIGILIIVVLALYAVLYAVVAMVRRQEAAVVFQQVRLRLGHGILLGLEFLVAGDIIHTVAVELTFETVGVLAIIVAIRTFLSFTLEVELTSRWPWQQKGGSS